MLDPPTLIRVGENDLVNVAAPLAATTKVEAESLPVTAKPPTVPVTLVAE